MKSKKISILASSTVLLLSIGLITGCADAEEEENAAPAVIAPISSEGDTYESAAAIEDESFSIEGLDEYEPIESISGMLEEATDTAGEATGNAVDSMLGMADSGADAAAGMVDSGVDAAAGMIDSGVDATAGMVDSGVDATADLIEDTQETALEVIETEPQALTQDAFAPDLIDDATDVVPATSDIVRGVQQGLTDAGFNPGPADGMSGPRTVAAINDFQNQNNLAGGGQLTKETLRALDVNF